MEEIHDNAQEHEPAESIRSKLQNGSLDENKELNFRTIPESPQVKQKAAEIQRLLEQDVVDRDKLRYYALSDGGLVNDQNRLKGWPILLGIDPKKSEHIPSEEELRKHPEYSQVLLDVNRSLKRFPPGIPYEQRVALQDQLTNLILRVISKYPHLSYYQGYHDVAITFLLVVGEELAYRIMEKLSTEYLQDCMEPTMEKVSHILNYVYPLIERLNPALCEHMERASVGTMFCLPWYLTWFGHSLNHYTDVVRLYDFFLCMPPLTPIYLAACIAAHRHAEVLATECDMALIHCMLCQLPDDLPFQKLIEDTIDLYEKFPPESVEAEVIERSRREKERMRLAEDAARSAKSKRKRHERRDDDDGKWKWALRYIPASKGQLFLMAVTIAVGLYAYLKTSEAQNSLHWLIPR